jgi:UDP-GlcNAc3NAcA epimerase
VRVLTVIGARPQFIKAAPVSRALAAGGHAEILVHTGQHYDDEMSAAFFRDLELAEPDVNLGVGGRSHAAMTGEMLRLLEPVVLDRRADVVLVYGDTNSTLAGALVASKIAYADGRRPQLAHVEAGLRSFERTMPEERNRVVADHLADLLLAPSAAAMANLEREGLADRAEEVGDVMVDAFAWGRERADEHLPPAARELPEYILLTLHRPHNVDDPARLALWLAALAEHGPVLFPVHPRTRAALEAAAISLPGHVRCLPAVGYLEMVALTARARAVATDSGGLQKEAYLAGVPCLTLRAETEWVETVATGWNRLVPSPEHFGGALDAVTTQPPPERPQLYGDGHAAERIVSALDRMEVRQA